VGLAADFTLLLCSLFWGLSFASMKILVELYPACWLLFMRFSVSAALILLFFHGRVRRNLRQSLKGGVVIGLVLFSAITAQTVALNFIEAGRQAFLTSTYVLIVPLILWAVKRVFPGWVTLGAAFLCLGGMAMLTDLSGQANKGDLLTLLCALLYAFQILAISRYAGGGDPITLSFVEFTTLSIAAFAAACMFEGPLTLKNEAVPELLFTIVICTFGCYMMQMCGQKYTLPSHAALIMGLESVFGLFSGIFFLGETLSLRMAVGCVLIFLAVLLAEIEPIFAEKSGS
jgi:drug/metabolite transporter (DMT)-like permease